MLQKKQNDYESATIKLEYFRLIKLAFGIILIFQSKEIDNLRLTIQGLILSSLFYLILGAKEINVVFHSKKYK